MNKELKKQFKIQRKSFTTQAGNYKIDISCENYKCSRKEKATMMNHIEVAVPEPGSEKDLLITHLFKCPNCGREVMLGQEKVK